MPLTLFPKAGPVIVSVIEFPAISVPTIVKVVEDKLPPSERIDIFPPNELCEIGVPRDVLAVTAALENTLSESVEFPVIQFPKSICIVPEPLVEDGEEKPPNSSVCEVAS